MHKTVAALASLLALSGCVTTPQYQWGNYENALYAGYHDPAQFEDMRVGLESHITTLEQGGIKVPPGLYAELGTLYLQSGKKDDALSMYKKESSTWPESRRLMTALIENLQRMDKPSETETKPTENNSPEGKDK